ncbi:unannotated protein [freshwater metagenome]|uniref:Unannotated protein n=1 Tax=freshwater metagenome TaxID=449393 RepID=A0A6J6B566_9ZZZZ
MTSRDTEVIIGTIMSATTVPTIKLDLSSGASASDRRKNGIALRCKFNQAATPTSGAWRAKNPHIPKMMLGMAASRSTEDVRMRRILAGEYSLMNKASPIAKGTATMSETVAMMIVPMSSPNTPKSPTVGFHTLVVKNETKPAFCNAGTALIAKNRAVPPMMNRLTAAALAQSVRKMRSPRVTVRAISRGTCSSSA